MSKPKKITAAQKRSLLKKCCRGAREISRAERTVTGALNQAHRLGARDVIRWLTPIRAKLIAAGADLDLPACRAR